MNYQTVSTTPLISLVGPPNSGKTTLFNYLSGQNYKTVNYYAINLVVRDVSNVE